MLHQVALIVDPDFGERLLPLADAMHVWCVASPANFAALQAWYARDPAQDFSFLRGGSSFPERPGIAPAALAASMIEAIDDHHGPQWVEGVGEIPAWSRLTVIGCGYEEPLVTALATYGFGLEGEVPGGFVADLG